MYHEPILPKCVSSQLWQAKCLISKFPNWLESSELVSIGKLWQLFQDFRVNFEMIPVNQLSNWNNKWQLIEPN